MFFSLAFFFFILFTQLLCCLFTDNARVTNCWKPASANWKKRTLWWKSQIDLPGDIYIYIYIYIRDCKKRTVRGEKLQERMNVLETWDFLRFLFFPFNLFIVCVSMFLKLFYCTVNRPWRWRFLLVFRVSLLYSMVSIWFLFCKKNNNKKKFFSWALRHINTS